MTGFGLGLYGSGNYSGTQPFTVGVTLSNSLREVSRALVTKFDDNSADLGLELVTYGDQNRIPTTPMLCVEPNYKTQELKGGGVNRMLRVIFNVYLIVYHSSVDSTEVNREDSDQTAQDIEDVIHADRTLGGLLIHCFINNIESGTATKGRIPVRASRLTFYGESQALLPS